MDPLAPPLSWKALKPDFGALLKVLGSLTAFHELSNMSGGDAGQDTDKHLFAIDVIARTGVVPSPLEWHPREALMQYRLRDPRARAESEQREAYAGRAFACAVLLRAACEEANLELIMAEIEDVQWFCESVMLLGKEVQELGARFLAQCAYEPDCLEELHPYVALGALILSMDTAGTEPTTIKGCSEYVNTLCDLYRRPRHKHWGETGEGAQEQVRRYGPLMNLARTQLGKGEALGGLEQMAALRKRLFGETA